GALAATLRETPEVLASRLVKAPSQLLPPVPVRCASCTHQPPGHMPSRSKVGTAGFAQLSPELRERLRRASQSDLHHDQGRARSAILYAWYGASAERYCECSHLGRVPMKRYAISSLIVGLAVAIPAFADDK